MKKIFISYTWENEEHKEWVKKLAMLLEKDSIDVNIDQWKLEPGDELTKYMEQSIRSSDYVLIICSEKYKNKSDSRNGGSGYEARLISDEIHKGVNKKKFIPILKDGNWDLVAPDFIKGNLYVDLSQDFKTDSFQTNYNDLLTTIYGVSKKPKVNKSGIPKEKIAKHLGVNVSDLDFIKNKEEVKEDNSIKIEGIITDEVTVPTNDGTRGSALYKIPFRISKSPDYLWKDLFVKNWNNPPKFTTMHRPGIAGVSGTRIILDGTTIEEVKNYHRDTLVLAVNKTNNEYDEIKEKQRREEERQQRIKKEHYEKIRKDSNEINFND